MFQQKYTIMQGIFILLKYFNLVHLLDFQLRILNTNDFKIEIVIKVNRVPLRPTLNF